MDSLVSPGADTESALRMQVPVIAKADSMTLEELRQFRKYIRSQLEQVSLLDLPEQHLLRISLASYGCGKGAEELLCRA